MTTDIDLGARCDRHVGDAFRPRCVECDAANAELEQERAAERHQRALERNTALGLHADQKKAQPTIRRFPYRQRR